MIVKLSLELPEEKTYVGMTRALARCALEFLKVEPATVDDIETIVGELANNVLYHAGGVSYRVDVEYHADHIAIVVTDEGVGFSFAEVPLPGTERGGSEGMERIGGFGLVLVQAMADQLHFFRTDPKGTTVRAVKNLRFVSEEAAAQAAILARSGGDPEGGPSITLGTRNTP
jgi:anti-sigma regulatory factor (Ser/Thr protein kinase)